MIIEAMELLFCDRVDGFALVSSDSDFTPLAQRLREAGKYVVGFGMSKTPLAFETACDRFINTEILNLMEKKTVKTSMILVDTKAKKILPTQTLDLLKKVISDSCNEEGWLELGRVRQLRNNFDLKIFGYRKLGDLFRDNADHFQVLSQKTTLLVRLVP